MEQVIMNLSINARDAMPHGGALTIETDHVSCGDSCPQCFAEIRPGHCVRVIVSDTGTGMDEETRQNLFEPFFTTKEMGHGTGLGLATVHGIVMQSGGHIGVESKRGAGTSFHFCLPAAEARIEATPEAASRPVAGGTETVLLVEDQDEVRRFVESVLRQNGYRVLAASSGLEALEKCSRERVDLLLTDVVMPKMSGSELASRIRDSYPSIKILFMSGYSNEMLAGHVDAMAGAAFIQKPFGNDALAEKVREVLGAARRPASAG
jgi:CheY-like chemotaxis protein